MPRYFFHVRDGENLIDEDGLNLASPQEARDQAVVAAGEMLNDKGGAFWREGEWMMHVIDDAGNTACEPRFSGKFGEPIA